MKIKVKTGKRGRPLEINVEESLYTLDKYGWRAIDELARQRKATSGIRGEFLMGSPTDLPDWYRYAMDALEEAQRTGVLSVQSARNIRRAEEVTRKLASRRESVRRAGLESYITAIYERDIESAIAGAETPRERQSLENIYKQYLKLDKQMRVRFAQSEWYQSPATISSNKYRNVQAWSEKELGQVLTPREAMSYLIERRIEDGLGVGYLPRVRDTLQ